ncbi:MAG: hypothetical protein ACM3YE_04145 [Bacteroidota bacterium]
MKVKSLLMAVIICLILTPFGYGENSNGPVGAESIEYSWSMDTAREIRTFTSDNTEATFQLDNKIVFEGKGSCKVIPSGKCEEVKLIVDLSKKNKQWEDRTKIVTNVYVPEGCPMNTCFAFVATYWPQWQWVDGTFALTKIEKVGGWNRVVYPITGKMQQLRSTKNCKLYLTFWHETTPNNKVPLAVSTPFYVDGIAFTN